MTYVHITFPFLLEPGLVWLLAGLLVACFRYAVYNKMNC